MSTSGRRVLEVTANLEVVAPGGEILQVKGDGARLRLEVSGLRSLWRVARAVSALPSQAERLAGAAELLPRAGLPFDLSVRDHVVASVEPCRRASMVGRLLGLPHLRVRLGGLMRALVA